MGWYPSTLLLFHRFNFLKEGIDVFKLAVNTGEADVGNFVDRFKLVHDKLTDDLTGDLVFTKAPDPGFDVIGNLG